MIYDDRVRPDKVRTDNSDNRRSGALVQEGRTVQYVNKLLASGGEKLSTHGG